MTTATAKASLRRALEDDESGELLESLAGSSAIREALEEPMADAVGGLCERFTRPNSKVGRLFVSDFVPAFVRGCHLPREHMTLQRWACGMPFALTLRDEERRARREGQNGTLTLAAIRCEPDCVGDGSWRGSAKRRSRGARRVL